MSGRARAYTVNGEVAYEAVAGSRQQAADHTVTPTVGQLDSLPAARCQLSHDAVLRPRDDLVLERFGEIAEVIAVACHADDQVAMPLRVRLRLAQRGGGDDVELDVVAAEREVGAHEADEPIEVRGGLERLRRELLVEERTARPRVIEARGGAEHRGRAAPVGALHGRDAFRDGLARVTA